MFVLEPWHWWVLTLLFTVFAAFLHSTYFLWMSISSAAVGAVLWFQPLVPALYQVLGFGLITLAGVALFQLFSPSEAPEEEAQSEQALPRGELYIGRVFTLDAPISNGLGKIEIDGRIWPVRGEQMEAGTDVRIVGIDGIHTSLLSVEKVEED